jgi:hypothetical protein
MGSLRSLSIVSSLALFACGEPSPYIEGFDPPERPGYTRYVTPIIKDIAPGTDDMWCQWLAPPAEADLDILEMLGDQSIGGHHAILYATSIASPAGTTRACRDSDLASVRYLGAIGGEGISGEEGRLPEGVVYRLPKGFALMANVHYTNYRAEPIEGQAVLDIKTSPPDPSRKVASLFVNIDVDVELPPMGPASMDVECTVQEDLPVFWFGNHMHGLGARAKSEIIHGDGTRELLREDPTWSAEFAFRPQFTRWPLETPKMLMTGDRIHTHCEWENTKDKEVRFPTEMCAGFGFYVGSGVQFNCVKGEWSN